MEAVAAIAANSGWLSAAASVASGLMSIRQGQDTASSMRFQGQMANLQAQERSLNYKREEVNANRQAAAIMERMQRANSAVVARAAAMNIMPFSGSPLDLQKYNTTKGMDEFGTAKDNAGTFKRAGQAALDMGNLQLSEANSAADSAESSGLMKGLFSIASGAFGFAKLGSAPSTDYGFSLPSKNLDYMGGGTGISSSARGLGLRFS